jgi:hypothetical protein
VCKQTHTGDYSGASYPFQCRAIGGQEDAVTLHIDGHLSTTDKELQVRVGSHITLQPELALLAA